MKNNVLFLLQRFFPAGYSTVLNICLCFLIGAAFFLPPEPVFGGLPIRVRLFGKMYLVPTGETGRHRDLLPLGLDEHRIVYLQVDSFHTTNREQSELQLLSDMQQYQPSLQVMNGHVLIPFLSEENLRNKQIAIFGYLYRMTGHFLIASTYFVEEKNLP